MDDFEFNYFGEEEGIEESEEFTDDYERRSVRVKECKNNRKRQDDITRTSRNRNMTRLGQLVSAVANERCFFLLIISQTLLL